jgi:hypothetical protein
MTRNIVRFLTSPLDVVRNPLKRNYPLILGLCLAVSTASAQFNFSTSSIAAAANLTNNGVPGCAAPSDGTSDAIFAYIDNANNLTAIRMSQYPGNVTTLSLPGDYTGNPTWVARFRSCALEHLMA